MKKETLKIIIALFILFILDLLNPFYYSLYCDFIFLGIVFLSLNFTLGISLVLSILFGSLRDSLSPYVKYFSIIEFPFIIIVVNYFLRNFQKKTIKIFTFFSILIAHIILNIYYIGLFSPLFSLFFLIHSSLLFLALNYLLKKWLIWQA
ncbi:MAG: hypothetical protein Q8O30_12860 [Candidatus Omnitrophota bacterium]|nr:hypothetical protein [Candidatus Omnitrophota bacterium]